MKQYLCQKQMIYSIYTNIERKKRIMSNKVTLTFEMDENGLHVSRDDDISLQLKKSIKKEIKKARQKINTYVDLSIEWIDSVIDARMQCVRCELEHGDCNDESCWSRHKKVSHESDNITETSVRSGPTADEYRYMKYHKTDDVPDVVKDMTDEF